MCVMATTRIKGGKKLDAFLRKAKGARGVGEVEVGFYSTAKYKDGTPLTNVALWQEFGTNGTNGVGKIPERPFFRIAIRKMEAPALALLKADVDPKTMVVTRRIAEKLGHSLGKRKSAGLSSASRRRRTQTLPFTAVCLGTAMARL